VGSRSAMQAAERGRPVALPKSLIGWWLFAADACRPEFVQQLPPDLVPPAQAAAKAEFHAFLGAKMISRRCG
jgi:hypothetical protein